ncbi:translocation/assembly module TamB domain-containing protein [Sphingomonas sp.]|uniref:translocation/assembly module TamB domain-containing protein n=1 Tax=Sphingomonas sp. TaxID=28214 RepID=UPI003B00A6E0
MRKAWRWAAGLIGALVALAAAVLIGIDTGPGHRFLTARIAGIHAGNGMRFTVGRIDGSIYGQARLSDVRVYDLDGLLVQAPDVALDWSPFRWLSNRLEIRSLTIPQATLFHAPYTRKSGKQGPILPGFDIGIGRLEVARLRLAAPVLGRERIGRLSGRAEVRAGRALVDLAAAVAGTDRLRVKLDAAPDRDRFDIDVAARGAGDGVLAKLAGIGVPVALDVAGDGSWTRWRGTATGQAGAARVVDLRLAADGGRYRLAGMLAPSVLLHGKLQRLTEPRVAVEGDGTLAARRLTGRLAVRSPAIAVQATGAIDLATSAFRNLRVAGQLLRPSALFPNMTARALQLHASFDGPFATARFEYRLDAQRFAFDQTGFEDAHAIGAGRLSPAPVTLPVRFVAARVTGVGDVAGGILRDLSVGGLLKVTATQVTGADLQLRSDKLTARIGLTLDLRTGRYEVILNGGLTRYLIPGIGLVDVRSTLNAVPGPDGHGTRLIGRGTAQVVRLDNAFFRSLAGGLPLIETGLERTTDGVLHFNGLRLTARAIRLAGNGYRRRDGTFRFEGAGTQASYGAFTLVLDGRIDRPTIDLRFARPNVTLGLKDVSAHLDPTADGFAFRADGGSRLGPFTAAGAILLPRGGEAAIDVAALNISGTRASGRLRIVSGGFDGRLQVAGGGLSGPVLLSVPGAVQQVEMHLDATDALLGGVATLRRGHLDLTVLLDPAGTRTTATATGAGLSRGSLRLARFAGTARLTGDTGEVRASIAGTRGRAFDIQTVTQVAADRYAIGAQGTLDRRPLRLLEPAVLVRDGAGWRLQPTRLSFSGGEARVGGRWTDEGVAIEAGLTRMPLAILDIGYPGLGLGGTASGTLAYATGSGAPTGRLDMTIRGLSRSGLVLTSQAVDLGIAGVLTPDRLGLRAVVAAGGKAIGRAQALLTPLAGGDLVARVRQAPLVAQLRYAGPADTLWRLTGVELFDLSGPVAIGADVGGTLARPSIRGAVRATGARIESATTGTVLTDVQATGRFGGSKLQIDRFTAQAGRGGGVTGAGQFDFAPTGGVGIGIDLRVQAKNAVMINRDDIGATVTGPLTFTSNGVGGIIGGDISLDRSRYRLGQATAASAVPRLSIREINLPDGGEEDDVPTAPWRLALRARAPGGLIVSGLGLSSEWSADLQIGGEPQNPSITGRATLVRGDYEFAGREFQLERGIIRFGGEVPANPALDIQANADSNGLSAAIRVTGTGLKPEIAFTSVPALPEDELLSRLLFGTSITNLSAPEALQLAAAVAALQNGGNGLNPINAVRRAAGLDRLRVLPADPQTGQGTSIAAGKYVTRRLYAEIVTDGQGYSATQVEFQVTRWLSLLSSISTLGRQSANVRVSRDY